ncbi:sugar porter family MFS transporter [Amycolatopsis sp. NBC_00345]|uniref:sugar porter family MFS transporter n=1 Tax=Amycolatopsis sp. NBC_00345 TaxID=2975955 RepID=UPI002E255F5E
MNGHRKSNFGIWFFGALGGILWGYDTGVISGALLYIDRDIPLSPIVQGLVVSGLLAGSMAGAGLAGRLADSLGRRKMILASGAVFTVGTLGAALAGGAPLLVAFRFVMGIGVGIASVVVPMYLSELAPKEVRGKLTSLMQLLVTIGILVAYITDYALSGAGAWRWMIGLGVVPAVLLMAGIYTQPESPRWLAVNKHDETGAKQVLAGLRGSESVAEAELADIRAGARAQAENEEPLRLRMLTGGRLRKVFTVGMLLVFFQNFVGINTIIYYAPTLLTNVGFGSSGAILANVGIGAVNMLMTLPAMRLIDRAGRRPLLLVGALGMCGAMILLAAANLAGMTKGPLLLGLTLSGIAIYVASFSVSWGPVQWVALPELFPLRVRAAAVGLCVVFNWLFNLVVALVFPPLLAKFGAGLNFLFFAVMTALAFVFVKKLMPETKGRSLEDLERELAEPSRT